MLALSCNTWQAYWALPIQAGGPVGGNQDTVPLPERNGLRDRSDSWAGSEFGSARFPSPVPRLETFSEDLQRNRGNCLPSVNPAGDLPRARYRARADSFAPSLDGS